MKKIITTFSVLLLYVICALGQDAVTVDFYQKSSGEIFVPQDKIVVFKLPEKPSNGFSWNVIKMDDNILELDPVYHYTPLNKGLGSDGYREIRVRAKKAGVSEVILVYNRPWENSKAREEATYTLKTEGAYTGSIQFKQNEYKAPALERKDFAVKALPSYYSLKDNGKMSSVKNQGNCGSCWAFAGCGVFENAIIMKDNVERDLSEQWMVNCGGSFGHNGCSGGFNPFDMYKNGAVYEVDEPYTASDGYCKSSYPKHEKIQSWSYIAGSSSTPSVSAIKQAIYDYGAIWCAVASSGMSNYTGGVWAGNGSTSIDHAVVLCGWDDNNQCWIMRNSWGASWGESGYIRIRYGANQIGYASSYLIYQGSGNDTQAPTAPSNLGSSNITSSSVGLSWTASTDNVGVTGYNIYKNGSLETNVTGTSANITGLSANTTYSFYVKAYDAAGNVSSASNTISVTTLDNGGDDYCTSSGDDYSYEWISKVQINSESKSSNAAGYSNFTATVFNMSAGSNSITLTPGFSSSSYNESWRIWIDFNGDKDFEDAGEQVFSQSGSSAVSGTITIPTSASGQTRMRVSMRYNNAPSACGSFDYGEVEDYTVNFGGNPNDTEPPTAPRSLTSSNITSSSVSLSWSASTDNVGVDHYTVYRNGSSVGNASSTSYNVTGLAASTTYSFTVKAFDAAGNASAASNAVSVTTLDDNPSQYCASRGSNSSYFWISYVGLNNMTNTTGNDGGYGDYTNKTASLSPGSNYTLYLQTGYSYYTYTVYWAIWIDYNKNGTFESTERILNGSTATTSQVSGSFTVPSSAATGNTRMRISMKYGSEATACETFSYGEVEDYTISIGYSAQNSVAVSNPNAVELGNVDRVSGVYPSPVEDILHARINALPQSDIKIITIEGRLIRTLKATGSEMDIDVSDLTPGLYLLQYKELDETKAERFIKK